MVDVAFAQEIARQFVIRREGAVGRILRRHQCDDVFEIAFRAALAHEQMHPEPQLLARFLQLRAFVIGTHASERIGIQILAAQPWRVAVDQLAFAGADLRQFAFHPEKNAGIIHQLRHARDAFVVDHLRQIGGMHAAHRSSPGASPECTTAA